MKIRVGKRNSYVRFLRVCGKEETGEKNAPIPPGSSLTEAVLHVCKPGAERSRSAFDASDPPGAPNPGSCAVREV